MRYFPLVLLWISANTFGQISWVKAGKYAAFKQDKRISDYKFTEVGFFQEGYAWVNQGNLYGYIDEKMDSITEYKYHVVSNFINGYAAVAIDSLYGFLDTSGAEICSLKYTRVLPFEHGYAAVLNKEGWNIINATGKEILKENLKFPPVIIGPDFIAISNGIHWGVVNEINQILYPFEYSFITKNGEAWRKGHKIWLSKL